MSGFVKAQIADKIDNLDNPFPNYGFLSFSSFGLLLWWCNFKFVFH